MKKLNLFYSLIAVLLLPAYGWAGGVTLQYRLQPGDVWVANMANQSDSSFMGQKQSNRNKQVMEYTISKGDRKGWVRLTVRIISRGEADASFDLSKVRFYADMHRSGEIRNARYEGSIYSEQQLAQMPAQSRAMMKQSEQSMMDAWMMGVFWFPELPEEGVSVGDEFEVTEKSGSSANAMMQMQTVSKQVYTLEEVSEGLAYFSVKQRWSSKMKTTMGGSSDTKSAGKGEAIFDLKAGMWVEQTTKSKSQVQFGGMAGMGGGSSDVLTISKVTMERR